MLFLEPICQLKVISTVVIIIIFALPKVIKGIVTSTGGNIEIKQFYLLCAYYFNFHVNSKFTFEKCNTLALGLGKKLFLELE